MQRETDPNGCVQGIALAPRSSSRGRAVLGSAALLTLLFAAGAGQAVADGNANFLLGTRNLADDDFWSLGDQRVAGVMVDFGRAGWPIHLSLANMSSSHDTNGRSESVAEYSFGVVKVWEPKSAIRPFVGAGIAAVRASFSVDQSGGQFVGADTVPGFYLDGGVFWRTGRRFNIGLGARLMTGTGVRIQDTRGNADYVQAHVLAGWGWPRREKRLSASPPPEAP